MGAPNVILSHRGRGRGSEISVCLKTVMVKVIQGDKKVSVHLIIKIQKLLG
jgi:hypothetical protein